MVTLNATTGRTQDLGVLRSSVACSCMFMAPRALYDKRAYPDLEIQQVY
jgi:hypothetical protein